MILRFLALMLAAAASLLAFEFFFQSILLGESYFNLHLVVLHRVLPGTIGIVLALNARLWWLRRKRRSGAAAQAGKKVENSI